MKKYTFLLLISAVSVFAQVPATLSPRRMWTATPDDITTVLLARAEKHITEGNIAKAEETIEAMRIIHANTLVTDEHNPDNTRVLKFTPKYIIAQFRSIADALESLIKLAPGMHIDQAKNIATTAQVYRDAAALIEFNSIPKPEVKQ